MSAAISGIESADENNGSLQKSKLNLSGQSNGSKSLHTSVLKETIENVQDSGAAHDIDKADTSEYMAGLP